MHHINLNKFSNSVCSKMCQHPAGYESSGHHITEDDPQFPGVSVGGRRKVVVHGGTRRSASGLQCQRPA